ncbi:sensor histidine kinase [Streptomyces vinaceus]|uniref:sensor histidine kinase n=1 Tax=Streptomyces vinaceus TaxID=1960 RepID=UPI003805ECFA
MRLRIAVLVALTTLVSTLLLAVPLAWFARHAYLQEADALALTRARVIREVLVGARGPDEAAARLEGLKSSAGRDTVFLANGSSMGAPRQRPAEVNGVMGSGLDKAIVEGPRRLVLVPAVFGEAKAVVAASVDTAGPERAIHRVWWAIAGAVLALPLMACALASRMGRGLVRAVDGLVAAAGSMSRGNLDTRVEPDGPPEIRRLATAFNCLSARIAARVDAERESAADISHRLRTPVTALMLEAETLSCPEESRRIMASADRLNRQVSYVIERARRPVPDQDGAESNVADVARDRVEFWAPLAEEQNRSCVLTVTGRSHRVFAAAEDVGAALDALLGNVFTHTAEGVGMHVRVHDDGPGTVVLTVTDEGPGIGLEHAVERGASGCGSSGLGLDIVHRTAQATGGSMSIGRSPQGGARVTVCFGAPAPV